MDLPIRNKLDFFGVNYYTRVHIRFNPLRKMGVELKYKDMERHGFTDTGWEIHPHGLERVLRYASKLAVPIIITENGIATQDDQKKIRFIKRHVDTVEKCLKAGMDIRGYFYWSLLDNYEWLRGFGARFGLYRVDFDTLDRIPTQAATYYSYLIQRRPLS
jgi:beta-glucosidase